MEGDYVHKFYFEDREGVKQGILSWNMGDNVLFPKLLSKFPSSNDRNFLNTNFGTSYLRRDTPTYWIFQEGCIKKEITIMQNLGHFKRGMFAKLLGTKSWGFLGQFT
jgi:hypothetical protein